MKEHAIRSEIERTVIHYYPNRALESPLGKVAFDYDPTFTTLKLVIADLKKKVDPELQHGTRGRYDISEELVLIGTLRLQLSYIAPFAALNYGIERDLDEDEREISERIAAVLEDHGISILEPSDLDERVPWIQRGGATVWDCLFLLPEE